MFSCPDCGQRYAHRSGLSRHRAATHRAPRVACSHCPRAFGNAHLLRVHQRRVHARRVCEVCGTHVEAELWSFHASLHVHPRARADLGLNCASCCRLFHPHKIAAHERECREIAPQTMPDAAAQRAAAYARYDAFLADTETPWDSRLRVFRASECNRVTDDALWCGLCNAVHWGRPPPREPGSHEWQSYCKICGKGFAHMQSLSRHKQRAHGGRETPVLPSSPDGAALPPAAPTVDAEALRRLLSGFAMLR